MLDLPPDQSWGQDQTRDAAIHLPLIGTAGRLCFVTRRLDTQGLK
jgi:hypothetical protein